MSKNSNLLNQLQEATGKRSKVRLTRRFPGEQFNSGFIVGNGRSIIVLQQFHDFYCEGYTALRLEDIVKFRSGKYERFWERILMSEGLMDNIGISYSVNPNNMFEMLGSLRNRATNLIVEVESENSADDDEFYLGKIIKLTPASVSLCCMDALGVWDSQPTVIPIANITKVQFDTPYINIFSRHAKPPENS